MMGLVLWKVNILKQYTAQPDDENLAAALLLTMADLAEIRAPGPLYTC